MAIELYNGCRGCPGQGYSQPRRHSLPAAATPQGCQENPVFPGSTFSFDFCFRPEPMAVCRTVIKDLCGRVVEDSGFSEIPEATPTNRIFEGNVTATPDWQYELRRYSDLAFTPGSNELVTQNFATAIFPGDEISWENGQEAYSTTVTRVYENDVVRGLEIKRFRFIQVGDRVPMTLAAGCYDVVVKPGFTARFRFEQTGCDCYRAILDPHQTKGLAIVAQSSYDTAEGFLLGYFHILEVVPYLNEHGSLFVNKRLLVESTLRTRNGYVPR